MASSFKKEIFKKHLSVQRYPATSVVCNQVTRILLLLFPEQARRKYDNESDFLDAFSKLESDMCHTLSQIKEEMEYSPDQVCNIFFDQKLSEIYELLKLDIEATLAGDPAAQSAYEIVRTYPGFYAIAFHRIAHAFYELKVPLIPRLIAEYAHSKTGIDIHPGATIDSHFCIDHGTGIVIGETTQIGKNVKLYQGVTLGALSVSKRMAETKRHPTIEDGVVIYAGATILGGRTVIGANSIIGGNVWVTKSVTPKSRVYHIPSTEVKNTKTTKTQ